MLYNHEKLLIAKHVLPIRVGQLSNLLEMKCDLANVDESVIITSVAVADNMEIRQGSLFVPYDEDDHICAEAVVKGAVAVLTDHLIEGIPCIIVADLTTAVYRFCLAFYSEINLPSVIVAGSEGKTTTKRMVKSVLQEEMQVFSQAGNYNTLQALCCSLQEIELGTQIVVQEVDEKRIRNTANCSLVLKPEIVLVTNIAEAHIGFYGGKEGLIGSFQGLAEGLAPGGCVILNADDSDSLAADFKAATLTVGIYSKNADCVASNITENQKGTEFDVTFRGKAIHIKLSVHGEHNIYNAMMAFLVGTLRGVSTRKILKGLKKYHNSGIRQNIVQLGNTVVYADCYNASLRSIDYALKCFCSIPKKRGKRVAVLGDIAEIEGYEDNTYKEIAKLVDQSNLDVVITCGESSHLILCNVKRNIEKHHADNLHELNSILRELEKIGKNNYLFKASRFICLENSIQAVFPHHYRVMLAQEHTDNSPKSWKQSCKIKLQHLYSFVKYVSHS